MVSREKARGKQGEGENRIEYIYSSLHKYNEIKVAALRHKNTTERQIHCERRWYRDRDRGIEGMRARKRERKGGRGEGG